MNSSTSGQVKGDTPNKTVNARSSVTRITKSASPSPSPKAATDNPRPATSKNAGPSSKASSSKVTGVKEAAIAKSSSVRTAAVPLNKSRPVTQKDPASPIKRLPSQKNGQQNGDKGPQQTPSPQVSKSEVGKKSVEGAQTSKPKVAKDGGSSTPTKPNGVAKREVGRPTVHGTVAKEKTTSLQPESNRPAQLKSLGSASSPAKPAKILSPTNPVKGISAPKKPVNSSNLPAKAAKITSSSPRPTATPSPNTKAAKTASPLIKTSKPTSGPAKATKSPTSPMNATCLPAKSNKTPPVKSVNTTSTSNQVKLGKQATVTTKPTSVLNKPANSSRATSKPATKTGKLVNEKCSAVKQVNNTQKPDIAENNESEILKLIKSETEQMDNSPAPVNEDLINNLDVANSKITENTVESAKGLICDAPLTLEPNTVPLELLESHLVDLQMQQSSLLEKCKESVEQPNRHLEEVKSTCDVVSASNKDSMTPTEHIMLRTTDVNTLMQPSHEALESPLESVETFVESVKPLEQEDRSLVSSLLEDTSFLLEQTKTLPNPENSTEKEGNYLVEQVTSATTDVHTALPPSHEVPGSLKETAETFMDSVNTLDEEDRSSISSLQEETSLELTKTWEQPVNNVEEEEQSPVEQVMFPTTDVNTPVQPSHDVMLPSLEAVERLPESFKPLEKEMATFSLAEKTPSLEQEKTLEEPVNKMEKVDSPAESLLEGSSSLELSNMLVESLNTLEESVKTTAQSVEEDLSFTLQIEKTTVDPAESSEEVEMQISELPEETVEIAEPLEVKHLASYDSVNDSVNKEPQKTQELVACSDELLEKPNVQPDTAYEEECSQTPVDKIIQSPVEHTEQSEDVQTSSLEQVTPLEEELELSEDEVGFVEEQVMTRQAKGSTLQRHVEESAMLHEDFCKPFEIEVTSSMEEITPSDEETELSKAGQETLQERITSEEQLDDQGFKCPVYHDKPIENVTVYSVDAITPLEEDTENLMEPVELNTTLAAQSDKCSEELMQLSDEEVDYTEKNNEEEPFIQLEVFKVQLREGEIIPGSSVLDKEVNKIFMSAEEEREREMLKSNDSLDQFNSVKEPFRYDEDTDSDFEVKSVEHQEWSNNKSTNLDLEDTLDDMQSKAELLNHFTGVEMFQESVNMIHESVKEPTKNLITIEKQLESIEADYMCSPVNSEQPDLIKYDAETTSDFMLKSVEHLEQSNKNTILDTEESLIETIRFEAEPIDNTTGIGIMSKVSVNILHDVREDPKDRITMGNNAQSEESVFKSMCFPVISEQPESTGGDTAKTGDHLEWINNKDINLDGEESPTKTITSEAEPINSNVDIQMFETSVNMMQESMQKPTEHLFTVEKELDSAEKDYECQPIHAEYPDPISYNAETTGDFVVESEGALEISNKMTQDPEVVETLKSNRQTTDYDEMFEETVHLMHKSMKEPTEQIIVGKQLDSAETESDYACSPVSPEQPGLKSVLFPEEPLSSLKDSEMALLETTSYPVDELKTLLEPLKCADHAEDFTASSICELIASPGNLITSPEKSVTAACQAADIIASQITEPLEKVEAWETELPNSTSMTITLPTVSDNIQLEPSEFLTLDNAYAKTLSEPLVEDLSMNVLVPMDSDSINLGDKAASFVEPTESVNVITMPVATQGDHCTVNYPLNHLEEPLTALTELETDKQENTEVKPFAQTAELEESSCKLTDTESSDVLYPSEETWSLSTNKDTETDKSQTNIVNMPNTTSSLADNYLHGFCSTEATEYLVEQPVNPEELSSRKEMFSDDAMHTIPGEAECENKENLFISPLRTVDSWVDGQEMGKEQWVLVEKEELVDFTEETEDRPQRPASLNQEGDSQDERNKAEEEAVERASVCSTLSDPQLAGKSSSETSTPEELRTYEDSSSGVESHSDDAATSPQTTLTPDPDLGIHMGQEEGSETPAGTPASNSKGTSHPLQNASIEELSEGTSLSGIISENDQLLCKIEETGFTCPQVSSVSREQRYEERAEESGCLRGNDD